MPARKKFDTQIFLGMVPIPSHLMTIYHIPYTFFKVTDVISKLGGSPLVQYSSLIYFDELEAEVSKLKHKWDREFDSLTNFYMKIIKAQVVDYVDLNNSISIIVNEAQEEIMEIENKIFEMQN